MRTVILFAATVLAAFGLAMLIVVPNLNPPAADLEQLFLFMGSSGGATVAVSALLRYTGILQRSRSIRFALLAALVLLVLLVVVNVWLVAELMFISQHDLVLTVALLIFASVIGIIAVWFTAQPIIERVQSLSDAVNRLGHGDLQVRLPVQGNDELARLIARFNQMAAALEQAEEQKHQLAQSRRDLIAWISHDLRTPLAAIRGMHEAILDGVVSDPATITRYIRSSQHEVESLSRLIDDLFTLSRADLGQMDMNKEPVSLRDLISDTLGSLAAQANRRAIKLQGSVESGIDTVQMVPEKIQRVLYNLLDNAQRYAPAQSVITLCAKRDGQAVHVSVHNAGPAIIPADMPRIFERFYQAEASRTQDTIQDERTHRGAGLGLAIARAFVEAHGGMIWVESTPEQGTTFTFSLPLEAQSMSR
ncbi:MAG: HAMP domain-containing histidine kinase [Anaerolineae bacterium]|nr:HAMP domain-containing histidine kinase [Anaerolineae bacterium]